MHTILTNGTDTIQFQDLLCVGHSALCFPCATSFYYLLILSWEYSSRQIGIIKKKVGSKKNLSFSNSKCSYSVENLTPKFTFFSWFHESHMKGHQMAPNREFLQLSSLQMMRQQTTGSCEDVAFGEENCSSGLSLQTFPSCGDVGKLVSLSGLRCGHR